MAQAAREHQVDLYRISFTGAMDALRHSATAMAQAKTAKKRRELWADLLHTLADDLVPLRPGRREPRAVKRRPKPYPRLMCHRSKFKEIQHQNRYYKNSPYAGKYRKSSRA